MAKALQCPSCGTKTRLDTVDGSGTFSCASCGQVLKAPPGLPSRKSASPGAAAAPAGAAGSAAPPVPPRRPRPVMAAGAGAAAGGTAVLSAPPAPARATVQPPIAAAPPRTSGDRGARETLSLPWRIAIWLVALPLALIVVGLPARKAGYLSSQKLLDVIVKHDLGRYVPLLVIIMLWALVTAVLVTLFNEIGRRMMARRRGRAGRNDDLAFANAASVGSPAAPAPPKRKRKR